MSKPVLLADSDPNVLMELAGLFDRRGFEVVSTHDGGDALARFLEREPAVVETAPKDTSEPETKEAADPVANENPPMTQAASEASEPAEDTSQPGLPFGDPLPEVAPPATETGLPSFLHRPSRMAQPIEADPSPVEESPPPEEDATAEPTARPAIVDVPHTPDEADYAAEPSILSRAGRVSRISTQDAGAVKPLLAQLAALRDQMASAHQEDRGR